MSTQDPLQAFYAQQNALLNSPLNQQTQALMQRYVMSAPDIQPAQPRANKSTAEDVVDGATNFLSGLQGGMKSRYAAKQLQQQAQAQQAQAQQRVHGIGSAFGVDDDTAQGYAALPSNLLNSMYAGHIQQQTADAELKTKQAEIEAKRNNLGLLMGGTPQEKAQAAVSLGTGDEKFIRNLLNENFTQGGVLDVEGKRLSNQGTQLTNAGQVQDLRMKKDEADLSGLGVNNVAQGLSGQINPLMFATRQGMINQSPQQIAGLANKKVLKSIGNLGVQHQTPQDAGFEIPEATQMLLDQGLQNAGQTVNNATQTVGNLFSDDETTRNQAAASAQQGVLNALLNAGKMGAQTFNQGLFGNEAQAIGRAIKALITPQGAATSTEKKSPDLSFVPQAYRGQVEGAASKYGIDAMRLARQLRQESGFNPRAVSKAGAQGIAQIMPATAKAWGVDPYNTGQAIDAMAQHMAQDYETYKRQGVGDDEAYMMALAKYNGGPEAPAFLRRKQWKVNPNKPPHAWEQETAKYVNSIMGQM